MFVKDILNVIEDFAPLSAQEGWDNCGLCVGSRESECKGVLIGLDCTETLVDEAIRRGMDLIITHHPMIFHGVKNITPDNELGRMIIKAAAFGFLKAAFESSRTRFRTPVVKYCCKFFSMVYVPFLRIHSLKYLYFLLLSVILGESISDGSFSPLLKNSCRLAITSYL